MALPATAQAAQQVLILSTSESTDQSTVNLYTEFSNAAGAGNVTQPTAATYLDTGTIAQSTFTTPAGAPYDVVVVMGHSVAISPANWAVIGNAVRNRWANSFVVFVDGCCDSTTNNTTNLLNLVLNPATGFGLAIGASESGIAPFPLNTGSPYAQFFSNLNPIIGYNLAYIDNIPAANALYLPIGAAPVGTGTTSAFGLFVPVGQSNGGAGACLFAVNDVSLFDPNVYGVGPPIPGTNPTTGTVTYDGNPINYNNNKGTIGPDFLAAAGPGGACGLPSISKSFSPAVVPTAGQTATLTITVNNSAVGPVTLTNLAVQDTLPAPLTVNGAATTTCTGGGTLSATGATVSLSGATLPAAGCTITVPVIWPAATACPTTSATIVTNTITPGAITGSSTSGFTTIAGQASTPASAGFSCGVFVTIPSPTAPTTIIANSGGNTVTKVGTWPPGYSVDGNGNIVVAANAPTVDPAQTLTYQSCTPAGDCTDTTVYVKTQQPAAPTAPQCTANPASAAATPAPGQQVTFTCTVDPGTSTTIPGATCTPSPATGTQVTCTGNADDLGNNPPATSTDPTTGASSTAPAPLQVVPGIGPSANLPPLAPVCTASPNPAANGASVTINCTGGTPGAEITIPGTNCAAPGSTLDGNGDITCTGTAGIAPGDIGNNPPVTVTDPGTGLSNSGDVPFQIDGSTSDPPLPVCTAAPGTADIGQTVTINCTGATPGDSLTIPNSSCNDVTIPASGNVTCTGTGGALGNNPPVSVTDTNGDTSTGTVPLDVNNIQPNAPVCTATPNTASPTGSVSISCTVDPNTTTTIPGCSPNPMTSGAGTTVTCTGTGASLGNDPPATSTGANGATNNSTVPLQVQGAATPSAPACTANPGAANPGAAVTITCSGTPGNTLTIPNTSCNGTPFPASGTLQCAGIAGTGTGQVNNNPTATTTAPNTAPPQSNSTVVPFQVGGSANQVLPTCVARPNPAALNQPVTITCSNVPPGDTVTIPGTDCTPSAAASATDTTIVCTGSGGSLGNNPAVTVTDPGTGAETQGNIPLSVIDQLLPIPAIGALIEGLLGLLLLGLGIASLRQRAWR